MKFFIASILLLCLLSLPTRAQYNRPSDIDMALIDDTTHCLGPKEYCVVGDSLFIRVNEYYDVAQKEWKYLGKIIFAPDSVDIRRTSGIHQKTEEWWK